MKLLFVHDHVFKRNNNRIYSNGGLADSVLQRYTNIFGNMVVAARIRDVDCADGLSLITDTGVTVTDAYSDGRKLEQLVVCAENIIVRLPGIIGLKAIYYAKKHNKNYLVELVGCPWDSYRYHSFKGKIAAPVMWFLTRYAVKNAPYVLYVTKEFLQKRYPTKGVSTACSDAEIRLIKTSERKWGTEVTTGTIGAVNLKYKGQQYVIKAISRLKKEGYKIKYRLIGNGDSIYLKNLAEKYGVLDNVEFVGPLPHNEIFGVMDSFDIYIQPSNADAMPRALLEAMSMGCPVIGSSTGGIPELVPPECVFKRKNVKDLTRVLKKAIDQKCDGLSQKSLERAKDFEKDKLDKKRTEFYKSFIEETKK